MKPLDNINKKNTVWAAVAAAVGTVWLVPGVQPAVISVIQHPTAQNVGAAAGVIITGALLYFSHPYGTSDAPKGN